MWRAGLRVFTFSALLHSAGVLVVVAVEAEEFPVAAVGRVVLVVVVAVMHSQLAKISAGKFPAAACADMGKQF